MSETEQLDKLKFLFINLRDPLFIYNKSNFFYNEDILIAKKTYEELLIKINNSQNLEEFQLNINDFEKIIYNKIKNLSNDKNGNNLLLEYYLEIYHLKDLSNAEHFIERGLLFLKENPNSKFVNEKLTSLKITDELEELANEIIEKFNLKYINLSKIYNTEESIKFLKKFDDCASLTFHKLGASPEICGINQNLGLHYSPFGNAKYYPIINTIAFNYVNLRSNSILHEWVHAVDFHVSKSFLNISSFTSETEQPFIRDSSPNSKAFELIRSITQELFSFTKKGVYDRKNEFDNLASKIFWSEILGPKYYGLTEEQKQYITSYEVIEKINNHLLNRNDSNTENFLFNIFKELNQDNKSFSKFDFRLKVDLVSADVLEIFKKSNLNINNNQIPSLYYLFSKLQSKLNKYNIGFGTNTIVDYWIQPPEMLARYFETQLFTKTVIEHNINSKSLVYMINKDPNFEDKKNKLISILFGEDKLIKNSGLSKKSVLDNILNIKKLLVKDISEINQNNMKDKI